MAITHPEHPAPITEGRCNALLWNCQGDDPESGERCEYHYENNADVECPICHTPRRRCLRYPLQGREACSYHGGKALQGINHPHYRGRGLSRHIPTRLLESYQLAMDDPDVVNLTEDVALFKARRDDLLRRIDDTPASQIWNDLQKEFSKYIQYRNDYAKTGKAKSASQANDSLLKVEKIIARGLIESLIWKEINDVEQTIIKLKVEERKRRKEIAEIITPEQFKTLLGYILNSIDTRVQDKDLKMELIGDIQKLNFRR